MPPILMMPLPNLLRNVPASSCVSLFLQPHLSTVGLCHISSAQLKSLPQLSGFLGSIKGAEWNKGIFSVWDKLAGGNKDDGSRMI